MSVSESVIAGDDTVYRVIFMGARDEHCEGRE